MKGKYVWWTLGLFILVLFPGPHGGFVPLSLVEITGVFATLTGNNDTIGIGIYILLHITSVFAFLFTGRQAKISRVRILFSVLTLLIQAASPIVMTLYLDNELKELTYITAIPFWVAVMFTSFHLINLYINEEQSPAGT